MKRLLLALTLLLAWNSFAGAAEFLVDGLRYSVISADDKTVELISGDVDYSSLKSVTIPETVTYANVTYSVTEIGFRAFASCVGLTSVSIPYSVYSIGEFAFSGCTGLTSIKVDKDNNTFDSRGDCNAIIETGSNTLIAGCKTTIIPNSVTKIGAFAFYGCADLTSVTIPNSVTSIGCAAFRGCAGLSRVTIGNSVTFFGEGAFSDCTALTRIEAYPKPQRYGLFIGVFDNVPKNCTLHVLPKYLSEYKTRAPWSDFSNIVADLTEDGGN